MKYNSIIFLPYTLVSFLLPHTSNSIDSSTVGFNLLSPVVFCVFSFTTISLSKGDNLPTQSHHCLTKFITFSLNSLKTGPILPFQLALSPQSLKFPVTYLGLPSSVFWLTMISLSGILYSFIFGCLNSDGPLKTISNIISLVFFFFDSPTRFNSLLI